ncbi:growth-regulating factor 6-like isoform X1 [Zingiber officinale]|uniref:growth-regulating factor 6-like isoform X1 n=1 Tax=Zingiber officinale TaxID=94328 RepID=UPI001C4A9A5F|nr:growth-regulating factor 6-like isoform X1 [Zingiber officinale]
MEFGGKVGLLAGASSESGAVFSSSMESSDAELSSQRATEAEEHGMRCLKLARTELRMPAPVKMSPFFTPNCLFPEGGGGEQMLSFSSPSKQGALMLTLDGTLPCYHHLSASTPAPSHMRNAGMHTGGSREHKHRVLARVNGLFTPPQWLEFERQALIYKHIVANISIPPNLLVSVRSGFGFPPFSAGYFGSSTLGWRQVGKEDPEPGRCRRTDGKKWRCARDVVADQKYCERHMNRGRHRSRKHVEGHIDHAANVIPTKSASAAPREGGTSGCLTNSLHQTECLQTNGCYPSQLDRMEMSTEKVNECTQDFGSLSSPYSLNSRNSSKLFPLSQEQNPFEEESCGFQHRFILMDSPFKPPSSSSDSIQCSDDELSRNQFVSWSAEEMQYDRTQLSISMPKSSSNLVPASPISKEQMSFSSQESNAINVVREGVPKEASQYQKGQVLISSWECSMAGPLGEVLNNSRHTTDEQCKNLFSSSINFLADGCDLNNWLESSPTHVLQKTNFRSVSSSAWSSPREDNRNSPENKGSLCDDILGSALLRVPTIPS